MGALTLRHFLGRASSIRFLHGEVEGGYVNPENTRDVVFDLHIHTALVDFVAKDHASKNIAGVMGNNPEPLHAANKLPQRRELLLQPRYGRHQRGQVIDNATHRPRCDHEIFDLLSRARELRVLLVAHKEGCFACE